MAADPPAASVVNAIGNSGCTDTVNGKTLTYWQDTAIVITWDDWGGWYDHVKPTILNGVEGDYQYGFRVPLIVVSAYTPVGYVVNHRHDFGTIQRFIDHSWHPRKASSVLPIVARLLRSGAVFQSKQRAPRTFTAIPAPKDANLFIHDPRPPEPPDNV